MAEDLEVMIAAVVIAMIVMYWGPDRWRLHRQASTTEMLALAFLVLIGVALLPTDRIPYPARLYLFRHDVAAGVAAFNVMARRNRRRRRPPA